jgi:hypothetical protein
MPVVYSATLLAVVAVYYVWRAFTQARQRRQRRLRHRVAYMLWVMAGQAGPDARRGRRPASGSGRFSRSK